MLQRTLLCVLLDFGEYTGLFVSLHKPLSQIGYIEELLCKNLIFLGEVDNRGVVVKIVDHFNVGHSGACSANRLCAGANIFQTSQIGRAHV